MNDLQQFETDLKVHLENTFSASNEEDKIKKLAETEDTIMQYISWYREQSNLAIRDLIGVTNDVLGAFAKSKINYIE